MCGRYTLTVDPADLQEAFYWADFSNINLAPRYNIAPTQGALAIPNTEEKKADYFTWGLVPFWAKDPIIGSRMINARSETIAEKPSFRNAFKRRRCLILADGFYEWQKVSGTKTKIPTFIRMKDGKPFAFAGLWENWHSPDGSQILSTTIITTQPNELMKPIHNRMPVILQESAYELWLTPGEMTSDKLSPLLVPFDADSMETYPVSRLVNNPRNDQPECVQPL